MMSLRQYLIYMLIPLALLVQANAWCDEDDDVPLDELHYHIRHLTAGELETEADVWLDRLRTAVRELDEAHIEVKRETEVLDRLREQHPPDSPEDEQSAEELAEEQLKTKSLERLEELQGRRTRLIDHLDLVVDELSAKLGVTAEGQEHEKVRRYRLYIDAVDGISVDTTDSQTFWSTIWGWMRSPEGGLRWLGQATNFVLMIALFWLLGIALSKLIEKALNLATGTSMLLKKFIVKSITRVMIIIGALVGLASTDINITPLLAVIGAAGFVIAFALQGTLSNFASGLMIMFYKPFDINDFLETANVTGWVKSMTLVTTNVLTPDNKLMVVPNNELWGNVITNVTGSSQRRVDMKFGIDYEDDISVAERVLGEIVSEHPKILDEPAPVIRVHELADSSVNLICRPWVATEDYWEVYWDVTRAVKERFDAAGLSIPFPQTDIHHYRPPIKKDADH